MNFLIITGGSRGIGKATAQQFVSKGWSVINLSRHSCDIESVINIHTDFSSSNWLSKAQSELSAVLKDGCRISLVHNAANNEKDNVQTLSAERLRNTFEINVVAPLQLNQILLDRMLVGSSIIYIGSTLSEKAVKNAASYVMSKHAVLGLMRSTCQDLVDTQIHTACVCPGFTDTAMLREHLNNDPNVLQAVEQRVGAKRFIQPSEIAEVIWFCANHPVINGSVLHANLGQIEQ